jgi:hypothetical protein
MEQKEQYKTNSPFNTHLGRPMMGDFINCSLSRKYIVSQTIIVMYLSQDCIPGVGGLAYPTQMSLKMYF